MKLNPKLIYLCQSLSCEQEHKQSKIKSYHVDSDWNTKEDQNPLQELCWSMTVFFFWLNFFPSQITQTRPGLELPFHGRHGHLRRGWRSRGTFSHCCLDDSLWALLASRFQANRIPLPIPFSGNPYLWHRLSTLVPAQACGMSSGHAKDGVAGTRQLVESEQGEGS